MSNHIHTIPVLDALREPGHCAFCVMFEKLERDSVQFIMGPAYMEDDIRMETNKIGFCKKHLKAMYEEQNRLGLGLMLHTYMQQLNKDVEKILKGKTPSSFFGKDPNSALSKLKNHLTKAHESCYVCNKVENTFDRYIDTFFHLWSKGGDESKLIKSQKSYCVPHFIQVLAAAEKLGRGKRDKFMEDIVPAWQNMLKELEGDIEWFTLKFDFRNANEPWKNSKEAVPRAMEILGGK